MAIIKEDKKIAIVGIFTLLHEPKKIYDKITLWNIALRRALHCCYHPRVAFEIFSPISIHSSHLLAR